MDVNQPLQLLGGISPAQFMRRHWQKKPLLVRQAVPGFVPELDRAALFRLAQDSAVSSRLVAACSGADGNGWKMRQGPFKKRALPPRSRPGWTLLVQGVDNLSDEVHALRQRFRFVPDSRLDDVMVSYASDQGGVGPHFDSYDVFLLQAAGRRRWRIARQSDLALQAGLPLKILSNFAAEEEYVLDPGDMLYLPPRVAHDGVALGECMTWSIGFRAPGAASIASELLNRLSMDADDRQHQRLYRDPGQSAVATPAAIPVSMAYFARAAVHTLLTEPGAIERALGETLSEPPPQVWFDSDAGPEAGAEGAVVLDRRTRMLYDQQHVFINGESFRAAGRDARLMRQLADSRQLSAALRRQASASARDLIMQWCSAGWLHGC